MYGEHLQDDKQISNAIIKYQELRTFITNVKNAFKWHQQNYIFMHMYIKYTAVERITAE